MAEDMVFLSRTVLLETENTVESADALDHAVEWYARGADFADALHLAACGSWVVHTFDRDFCRAARESGIAPAVQIWEV
jgi:predicted nucleic-acid-binding protein